MSIWLLPFQSYTVLRQDYKISIAYFETIKSTCSLTFLGAVIDENINYKSQIHYLSHKINSTCFVLRAISHVFSFSTLKTIYYAYVMCILTLDMM